MMDGTTRVHTEAEYRRIYDYSGSFYHFMPTDGRPPMIRTKDVYDGLFHIWWSGDSPCLVTRRDGAVCWTTTRTYQNNGSWYNEESRLYETERAMAQERALAEAQEAQAAQGEQG